MQEGTNLLEQGRIGHHSDVTLPGRGQILRAVLPASRSAIANRSVPEGDVQSRRMNRLTRS
jgi:hypothetical protein